MSSDIRFLYTWMVVAFRTAVTSIGIPGNLLIIFVYWNKSVLGSAQIFILVIAFSDLCSCLVLPLEVYYWLFEFNFPSDVLCKIFFTWESIGWYFSSYLTGAIAVDRYLSVSRPYSGRLSRRSSILICWSCLVVAMAVNVLIPFVSRTMTVDVVININYTIEEAKVCFHYGGDPTSVVSLIATVPQYISFLFVFGVIIFVYVRLWKFIKSRQRVSAQLPRASADQRHPSANRLKTSLSQNVPRPSLTATSSRKLGTHRRCDVTSVVCPREGIQTDAVNTSRGTVSFLSGDQKCNGKISCDLGQRLSNQLPPADQSRLKSQRLMSHLSKMLLLVTIFFVITWSLTLVTYIFSPTALGISRDSFTYAAIAVLRLTGLLNHAVNPFLYSFINDKFRADCCGLYKRLKRKLF